VIYQTKSNVVLLMYDQKLTNQKDNGKTKTEKNVEQYRICEGGLVGHITLTQSIPRLTAP